MHEYTAVISQSAAFAQAKLKSEFDVIVLPPDGSIAEPVSSHPDMLMFSMDDVLVIPEEYYHRNRFLLDGLAKKCSLSIITSKGERGEKYPLDIGLNVLLSERTAFSLIKHTSPEVLSLLKNRNIRHFNVKQGYSACSSLAAGGAIITADRSISKAARSAEIPTLEITQGNITLEGYNEGFIGGASGVCENKVYFLGNLDTHPEGEKIRRFLLLRGFECLSLSCNVLRDCGGIKFFRNKVKL